MLRVSANMMGDNLINISKRNTERMLELQNSIATGLQHRMPRENPNDRSKWALDCSAAGSSYWPGDLNFTRFIH